MNEEIRRGNEKFSVAIARRWEHKAHLRDPFPNPSSHARMPRQEDLRQTTFSDGLDQKKNGQWAAM